MAARPSLRVLARDVHDCRNCDLWRHATQAVFGEGAKAARLFFVGEQPGDVEDREGHPFVGPAGRLLDRALEAAGLSRKDVYITNAVKHFKWEPRGKRRLHSKPNQTEINACHPWLESEIAAVRPDVIVCLGATAAQALLGKSFRITKERGTWQESPLGPRVMATYHPAALLRARAQQDEKTREAMMAEFYGDIARAARGVEAVTARSTPSPRPSRAHRADSL